LPLRPARSLSPFPAIGGVWCLWVLLPQINTDFRLLAGLDKETYATVLRAESTAMAKRASHREVRGGSGKRSGRDSRRRLNMSGLRGKIAVKQDVSGAGSGQPAALPILNHGVTRICGCLIKWRLLFTSVTDGALCWQRWLTNLFRADIPVVGGDQRPHGGGG